MDKWVGFAAATLTGASVALLGCQGAGIARRPLDATDQAATAELPRCTREQADALLARVMDGSAVERVDPIYNGFASKTSNPRLLGAAITVRPAPGETAAWLERSVECYASAQRREDPGPRMASDPFVLPGSPVEIEVTPVRDALRIDATGQSSDDARIILARAQALLATANR